MKSNLLIDGRLVDGSMDAYASYDPATGLKISDVASADEHDVSKAVESAHNAMHSDGWARLRQHERASYLHAIANKIQENAEELARLQTLDNGKSIYETRALAASAAGTFRFYASVCETWSGDVVPNRGDYLNLSVYEPIGVVGAISPWNSPLASDAQKIAPALAAGNAVVLKPASVAPLVSLRLGSLCLEAGLPPGLVNVVTGKGSVVGDALVRHPLVKMVTFTGGTETGRGIAQLAAEKLMRVSLELGGKSPNIVFEDADLDHAIAGVLYGIYSASGQSCIAGSRLYVHAPIYEKFKALLLAAASTIKIGHPLDPATRMGPLVSHAHREGVEARVEQAIADGASVLHGGNRPDDPQLAKGYYFLPTILSGAGINAEINQEEIFGPVLTITPFENEDELLVYANSTKFGLAAGIWTSSYERAFRLSRQIDAGTVWINTYKQLSIAAPFGGNRDSGTGREKSASGLLPYLKQKSLFLGMHPEPINWYRSS
ncbi:aldehyde dehydrogenase [Pusillimonas noertemannii]|uniref:aldehyde dehydrogenase n=1 Tax=Pusillimonas noertemannii TaxID=305977 RepID=UPI003342BC13